MITRHVRSGITWIDIESPTRQELKDITSEFSIDIRIEEEIISPTPYPVFVDNDRYAYLVLHFPTSDPHGGAKNQEIDFIVSKDFLITCRYEVIHSIHTLHKVFESEELLGISKRKPHTADLLERILRQMYSTISEEAEEFGLVLDRIEEKIFTGTEDNIVLTISLIGRVLLRFHTTLARHSDSLTNFLQVLTHPKFFGPSFKVHISHIEAEHRHAANVVSSFREVADELRETNDSLVSTRQNEIVNRLTTIAFAAFPVTVIIELFGMNLEYVPLTHSPYAFWVILVMTFVILAGFLLYFRYKRWL